MNGAQSPYPGQDRNPNANASQASKMLPQHFERLTDRLTNLSTKVNQLEDFAERLMGSPVHTEPSNAPVKSDKPLSIPGLMASSDVTFCELLSRLEGIIKHLNCAV